MTNTTNPKLLPVEIAYQLMMGPIYDMIHDTPGFAYDNEIDGVEVGYDETQAHYRQPRGDAAGDPTLVRANKRPTRGILVADLTRAQTELNTTHEALMIDLAENQATLDTRRDERTTRLN